MLTPAGSRLVALSCLFILFLALIPGQSCAQRQFGIRYSFPSDEERLNYDLRYLRQTGIYNLLVEELPNTRSLQVVEEQGFNIYAAVPVVFPTNWSLNRYRDEWINQWTDYLLHYQHFRNVRGIGLFSFGQTHNEHFHDFFQTLTDELREISDLPLFFITSSPADQNYSGLFDFMLFQTGDTLSVSRLGSFDHLGGVLYVPDEMNFNLREFQALLGQTREAGELPVFFNWDWFAVNVNRNALIGEVIYAYAHDPDALFANPRPAQQQASSNWLILILLITWCSFMAHYSFIPTYRKSLFRFFDTHKFFIDDVVSRPIRIGQSNFIILLQQGMLGGLFLLSLTSYLLESRGYEALIYHLPFIHPYQPGDVVIFFSGFLTVLILNMFFTGWLYLLNNDIRHISQAAIFQLWPQHVNLVVVTILITLVISGSPIASINITALVFLLVFLGSFVFGVVDAGKHTKTRFYYYPLTLVVFGVLLAAFLIWLFFATGFFDAWDLAVSL